MEKIFGKPFSTIIVSPNRKYFVAIGHRFKIFNFDTKTQIFDKKVIKDIVSVSFSSDESIMVIRNPHGEILFFDMIKLEEIILLNTKMGLGSPSLFTSNDEYLIATDNDGNIAVVNAVTYKITYTKILDNSMITKLQNINDTIYIQALIKGTDKRMLYTWNHPFKADSLKSIYKGIITGCNGFEFSPYTNEIFHSRYYNYKNCMPLIKRDLSNTVLDSIKDLSNVTNGNLQLPIFKCYSHKLNLFIYCLNNRIIFIDTTHFNELNSFDMENVNGLEVTADEEILIISTMSGVYCEFLNDY